MGPQESFRQDVIALASRASGLKSKEVEALIERPPNPEMGDLALPCFALAKKLRKPPQEIASGVALKVKPKGLVRGAGATGPYVNFFLDWDRYGQLILRDVIKSGERYGSGKKTGQKMMVEYAHPNTHKAFHIGHVRTISLGESLSRILEFSGTRVVRANYQGDIGPQVAKCLWGFINIHKEKAPSKNQGRWLGKVYRDANKRISKSKKAEREMREINKMLYNRDKKIIPVWKKTRKWSLDYFDSIYRDFGTKFDRLYFETEVEKPGLEKSKALVKKKIAKVNEGAIIVDLEKEGLGVFVLVTGEDVPTYFGKELGLAQMQYDEYEPDRLIHVVGSEQTQFFKQLFALEEKIGMKIAKAQYHLRYELVNLSSGKKMKSREGEVILYDELKEKLYKLALKATSEKNPKLSKSEKEKTAMLVALGALKYDMISQSPEKVIAFDWESALDFQGNSAPYIQYTHARACSILRKSRKPSKYDASLLSEDSEKALLSKVAQFPGEVSRAARDMRPHYIANYAYSLADLFNNFYQAVPVLKAESKTRDARLALVEAARTTLKNALCLLGIEAPERM